MGWYRDISEILADEPEDWLAYMPGQQIEKLPLLQHKQARYRGALRQLALCLFIFLRDWKATKLSTPKRQADFLVFADTMNQMGAVDDTIEWLRKSGELVTAVSSKKNLLGSIQKARYRPIQLSTGDVLRALLLLVLKGPELYRRLRAKNATLATLHFATFASVYKHLVYFHRVLSRVNPKFAVTANDHNAPNRCMLALAHHFGVNTVYLQHASVSAIFPALKVDYAFLDGQCSLDTYRLCEANRPQTKRSAPSPKVMLTGQKKHVRPGPKGASGIVGFALNALDSSSAAIAFVEKITAHGHSVLLRWHPGQARRDTAKYRSIFENNQLVTLSDPQRESVSDFLSKVRWLIAGNSSIHLEAALSGAVPIYHELTPSHLTDYYGYVRHGLAWQADSTAAVLQLLEKSPAIDGPNVEAVRYYSATYQTEWEGREGELVARCLLKIRSEEAPPVIFLSLALP